LRGQLPVVAVDLLFGDQASEGAMEAGICVRPATKQMDETKRWIDSAGSYSYSSRALPRDGDTISLITPSEQGT
jgi:hypothetical protein